MKQLRFGIAALALALLASCGSSETTETEIASDTSTMPAGTNDMGSGISDMNVMDTTITGTNTTNNGTGTGTGTGTTSGGTGATDTMMNR